MVILHMSANDSSIQNALATIAYHTGANPTNAMVPSIIEKTARGERSFDVFSRLLDQRIIYIAGQVDEASMAVATASIINLATEAKPIRIFISSPGGQVMPGLAFTDCMDLVKEGKLGKSPCTVETFVLGYAMSFGAVISAKGSKGHRYALPSSRIMIHQVSSGFQGQSTDIQIQARETELLRNTLDQTLADASNVSFKEMQAMTERDTFLSASQAKEIGLVDHVMGE